SRSSTSSRTRRLTTRASRVRKDELVSDRSTVTPSGSGASTAAPDLSIAQANGADREWAAQLMVRSEPWTTLRRPLEACRAVLNDPEFQIFVSRTRGERSGFLVLDPRGMAGAPYLKSVAIAPEFRGSGLGSRLLAFAEEHVRPRARHLFLCVSSFNDRARQ